MPKVSTKSNGKKVPILVCLLMLHRAGMKSNVPRQQVASLTNYTKESLRVMLGKLRGKGYVDYDRTTVTITATGLEAAKKEAKNNGHDLDDGLDLTNESTQDRIKETYKLSGAKAKIYDLLLDGKAHPREDIMAAIACTNKDSFRVFIGSLSTNGLVEQFNQGKKKMLKLSDLCFPFGRPE